MDSDWLIAMGLRGNHLQWTNLHSHAGAWERVKTQVSIEYEIVHQRVPKACRYIVLIR